MLQPTPIQVGGCGADLSPRRNRTRLLEEAAALAAVGGHLVHDLAPRHEVQVSKRSHSSPALAWRRYTFVATRRDAAAAPAHRGLHLARALHRVELQPGRQVRLGQAVSPGRAGGEVAAAEQRRPCPGARAAHDRQREHRGRSQREARSSGRTASGRRSPSRRSARSLPASAPVVCRLPVPPPLTSSTGATALTAATTAARRSAISAADARCIRRIAGPCSGLPERPVADARDVALVAHHPGQLEPRSRRRSRAPAPRACVGRADRRALGPDLHPPPRQVEAGVELDADADRGGRRGRARRRSGRAGRPSRPSRSGRASPSSVPSSARRGAVGGRDRRAAGRRSRAPCSHSVSAQRERHQPAEALVAREDPLQQRPAAHRLAGHADRLAGGAADASRPRSPTWRRGPPARTARPARRRCARAPRAGRPRRGSAESGGVRGGHDPDHPTPGSLAAMTDARAAPGCRPRAGARGRWRRCRSGASLAKTLFDEVGPGGTVLLRMVFARWCWPPSGARRCAGSGAAGLGAHRRLRRGLAGMNFSFYERSTGIPLGVAVTLEFVGPLGVAVAGSRRALDLLWVALAAAGILLLADLGGDGGADALGVVLALLAGAFWAAYILIAARVGKALPGGAGLAWRWWWPAPCCCRWAWPTRARPAGARGAGRRPGRGDALLRDPLLAGAGGAAAACRRGVRRADEPRAGRWLPWPGSWCSARCWARARSWRSGWWWSPARARPAAPDASGARLTAFAPIGAAVRSAFERSPGLDQGEARAPSARARATRCRPRGAARRARPRLARRAAVTPARR